MQLRARMYMKVVSVGLIGARLYDSAFRVIKVSRDCIQIQQNFWCANIGKEDNYRYVSTVYTKIMFLLVVHRVKGTLKGILHVE